MAEGAQKLLTPADDGWHRVSDDPWLTEGSWWCFFVPERSLDCWLYHLSRPNLGLAGGGVWVFDDRATSFLEIPYYANLNQQRLDPDADLNRMVWPDGVALETLEPLTRYRLTYHDSDLVDVDVMFERLTEPWVTIEGNPPRATRWEEPARVTGELVLHGQRLEVDSIAFRDHSWTTHRPEDMYRPRALPPRSPEEWGQAPPAYVFGTASAESGFFAFGRGSYLLSHSGAGWPCRPRQHHKPYITPDSRTTVGQVSGPRFLLSSSMVPRMREALNGSTSGLAPTPVMSLCLHLSSVCGLGVATFD